MQTTQQKQFLVTQETVSVAAGELESAGTKPSVRTVMARLGGGSPNTISIYLNQWRERRPVIQSRQEIQIDPAIAALIAAQIQKAAAEASISANAERAATEADMNLIAGRGAELEQQGRDDAARIVDLEAKSQRDFGVIDSLTISVAAAKSDAIAEISAARLDARIQVEKADGDAKTERARADLLISDLGSAKSKNSTLQESVDFLKTENERNRGANLEAQKQLVLLEKQLAVSETKKDLAENSNKQLSGSLEALTNQAVDLRLKVASVEQSNSSTSRENAALLGRLSEADAAAKNLILKIEQVIAEAAKNVKLGADRLAAVESTSHAAQLENGSLKAKLEMALAKKAVEK